MNILLSHTTAVCDQLWLFINYIVDIGVGGVTYASLNIRVTVRLTDEFYTTQQLTDYTGKWQRQYKLSILALNKTNYEQPPQTLAILQI